jgi:Holliday junction resolvase RusA-like endonuclease
MPSRYRAWKGGVAMLLRSKRHSMGIPDESRCHVVIDLEPNGFRIEVHDLGSWSARAKMRGDIDNYAKAILDAAQDAGLFKDDRQVEALTVRFSPVPAKEEA